MAPGNKWAKGFVIVFFASQSRLMCGHYTTNDPENVYATEYKCFDDPIFGRKTEVSPASVPTSER